LGNSYPCKEFCSFFKYFIKAFDFPVKGGRPVIYPGGSVSLYIVCLVSMFLNFNKGTQSDFLSETSLTSGRVLLTTGLCSPVLNFTPLFLTMTIP